MQNKQIDIKKFDVPKKKEEYTAAQLVKTVLDSKAIMNALPEWMYSIDIPEDTIAAKLSPTQCFMKLNLMAKDLTLQISPNYTLGKFYATTDVQVTPTGITTDKKTIATNMGVLSEEPDNVIASINATVLTYTTRVSPSGKEVSDVVFPEKLRVPTVSLSSCREILENFTKSEVVARDEIYQQCVGQVDLNYKLHSAIGEQLSNYTDNDEVTTTMGFPCKLVGVPAGFDVPVSDNISGMYRLKQDASAARGEENGKGTLTAGYLLFDMLPNDSKILNLIRDFRNVMRVTASKVLSLPAAKIPHEVALSLSMEYIVEYEGSSAYPPYADQKCGIFSSVMSNLPTMRFKHVNSNDIRPTVTKKLVDYHDEYLKNVVSLLKMNKEYFSYIYITPKPDKGLSLFPVSDADSLKVLAFAKREIDSPTVSDLAIRSCVAMAFRNNYPFYRKPFYDSDPFGKLVNWDETIKIKTTRIKKVQDTYSVQTVSFAPTQLSSTIVKKVTKDVKPVQRIIVPPTPQMPSALVDYLDNLPQDIESIVSKLSTRETIIPVNILAAIDKIGLEAVFVAISKKRKIQLNELTRAYDARAKRFLQNQAGQVENKVTPPVTVVKEKEPELTQENIDDDNDNSVTDNDDDDNPVDDNEPKVDISKFDLAGPKSGLKLNIFKQLQ